MGIETDRFEGIEPFETLTLFGGKREVVSFGDGCGAGITRVRVNDERRQSNRRCCTNKGEGQAFPNPRNFIRKIRRNRELREKTRRKIKSEQFRLPQHCTLVQY